MTLQQQPKTKQGPHSLKMWPRQHHEFQEFEQPLRQMLVVELNFASAKDASHGLTGPRAKAGRSRERVAIPHIKRLGPTKSSSHRTEVQILVPTPSPSLRGHNWSTALLAARVRFRD